MTDALRRRFTNTGVKLGFLGWQDVRAEMLARRHGVPRLSLGQNLPEVGSLLLGTMVGVS